MIVHKRMYKVISPLERRDGGKFWQRCGTAYTNKDESINVYLDVIPTKADFTLQLRELTEEELRNNSERRASSTPPANHMPPPPNSATAALPF